MRAEKATPPEPSWSNQSSALSTAWLTAFQRAVQAKDEKAVLFHPGAIVYGGEPLEPCDGGLKISFEINVEQAKILPLDPAYSLVICEWTARPIIIGADKLNGHATFVLYITQPKGEHKGSVLCVHAHYSRAP